MGYATVCGERHEDCGRDGDSRSEVWRLIQQLRGWCGCGGASGDGVSTALGAGFALAGDVGGGVEGHGLRYAIGRELRQANSSLYQESGRPSEAMHAASEGAPKAACFLPKSNSAGAGTRRALVHSARSSGFMFVILRPAMPPSDALIFFVARGWRWRAAVEEIAPQLSSRLKWPNDLLLGGKKFCGISRK